MTIQLGILHILASHADGFASIASINADMGMLSGADWSRKLRELAKRAGPISIFSDRLVERVPGGWRITEAGRQVVASLEAVSRGESAAAPSGLRLVASQGTPVTAAHPEGATRLRRSLRRLVAIQ